MSQKTDQDRARIRAYHRDRAIVNKIGAERTAYAVDRMSEPELRLMASTAISEARRIAQEGRDIRLARLLRDAEGATEELFLRGHQLTMFSALD